MADSWRWQRPSWCSLSRVRLIATPWTAAYQAPLSMEFSRQEYWSGLPCPPPGSLPDPGIEPTSLRSPALSGGFFTTSVPWEVHNLVLTNTLTMKEMQQANRNCGWMFCCFRAVPDSFLSPRAVPIPSFSPAFLYHPSPTHHLDCLDPCGQAEQCTSHF